MHGLGRYLLRMVAGALPLAAPAGASAQAQPPALEPVAVGAPGILGRQGNRDAVTTQNAISADGRWVVFSTRANNLDPADRDAFDDVYLAATDGSSTRRISGTPPGSPRRTAIQPAISPDGRWIAWREIQGDSDQFRTALMLHDRSSSQTATLAASEPGDFGVFANIALSGDATHLAFWSDLALAPDDLDERFDAYVWTRADGAFRRISRAADGSSLGSVHPEVPITPDGRHVAFATALDPSVPGSTSAVHVIDLATGDRDEIRGPAGGPLLSSFRGLDLSDDGRWLALGTGNALLPKDINAREDVYVFDRVSRSFELASVSSAGALRACGSLSPSISGDGRHVAFVSCGFPVNPESGTIYAVFLRDRSQGRTVLISRPFDGGVHIDSRGILPRPAVSADGANVVFFSESEYLVEGDSNRRIDAFLVDVSSLALRRVGTAPVSSLPAGASATWGEPGAVYPVHPSLGGDHVLFSTAADNLLLSRSIGAMRTDTRRRAVSDALPFPQPYPPTGPPGAVEVAQGISDGGSTVLVRRVALWVDFFTPPGPEVPRDLWLYGTGTGSLRVDTDPALGPNHEVVDAVLSGDGRRVAFLSQEFNPPAPPGVYRFDVDTGSTLRIDRLPSGASPAVGASGSLALSRNGRWLVFASAADGLVAGDDDGSLDVFLADLVDGGLRRLLKPASGLPLLGFSIDGSALAVSDSGERVLFVTDRSDLAPGGPASRALYLLDLTVGRLLRLSRPDPADSAFASSPSISADGRRVAFLDNTVLRVLELGVDASIVGEPTAALPAIRALYATISPDGYAVALSSAETFHWVPGWLAGDGATPLLLRLPEPALFGDGFEAGERPEGAH